MITDPSRMPEIQKLKNRVLRLYGMNKITMDQHVNALQLLEMLVDTLSSSEFKVSFEIDYKVSEEEFDAAPEMPIMEAA